MQCIRPPSAFSAEPWPKEATPNLLTAHLAAAAHAAPDAAYAGGAEATGTPATPERARPIGVFDSGIGGLTVVRALQQALPHERFVYLGDTARVPYGLRSPDVVRRYAQNCAAFLLTQGVKMVVVACNTASAHALADLQAALPVPVLGVIEAGALQAAEAFRTGQIGVLATEGTVQSGAYVRALSCLAPQLQVRQVACPLFVPLCEEGLVEHPATRLFAQDYLASFAGAELDALLLGCTHYPLLMPLLAELVGPQVRLLDSATAVAAAVARSLAETRLAAERRPTGATLQLYATDVTVRLRRVAQTFLGGPVPPVQLVDLT